MQGTIVEIADHPITGQKRKVEIHGLVISFSREEISLPTICTYYENNNGEYGPPVTIPAPIVINRPLYARTSGENVVFVKATTGQVVNRMFRDVETELGTETQEYWVLDSDGVTEVPVEQVTKMFHFLVHILRNVPIINEQLMIQFVLDEVNLGTYDQVGR